MLFGKVNSNLNRIGQRNSVYDSCSCVVGVAGPVDLAALAHHEEAGVVVEHFNALPDMVGKRPLLVCAVNFIKHGVGVSQMLVNNDYLAVGRCNCLCISLLKDNLVAGFFRQFIEAGLVFVGTGDSFETAAGKEFKARGYHFFADFIIVVAAGLMGIERCRRGVVDVDGADDADLPALLAVELLGNRLIGFRAGNVDVNHTGIGFVAGGNRGRSRGRVGRKAAKVVCNSSTRNLKIHKVQRYGASENYAFTLVIFDAGKSLDIAVVGNRAEVVGCSLNLRVTHTVSDKQEDVFWRLYGFSFRGRGFSSLLWRI